MASLRPLWFPIASALTIALAFLALTTPSSVSPDVSPERFSAGRAMKDIRIVAEKAHPIGSADVERVRVYLLERMTALGLAPERRRAVGTFSLPERRVFVAGEVVDLVGVLPGEDRTLPAILLMAHYDTVPRSPGAADDTAGVASALEIVANLKAAGPRLRDVIVLFTDGEEAGLLGSNAFFTNDPLAKRVGIVINLEARGGGGRTVMFETSDKAGGLVEAYRKAPLPSANSLTAFVYRHMPNGTDLTNALRRGYAGLNFAFIGDEFDYHTAHATPDNIDPGSVQHMGDSVLPLVKALAVAKSLPPATADLVYSDILGRGFVSYPLEAGWAPIAFAFALIVVGWWRIRRRGVAGAGAVARGALLLLAMTAAVAIVLGFLGWAMLGLSDMQGKYALLSRYGLAFGGYVAIGAGTALFALAGSLRLLRKQVAGLEVSWLGALILLLVIAIALQIFATATGFIMAWPLVMAAVSFALFVLLSPRSELAALMVATAVGVLGAAQAAEWGGQIFTALGVNLPVLLAALVLPTAALLWPSIVQLLGSPWRHRLSALLLAGGLASVLAARWLPADAGHPHPTEAFFVAGPTPQDFRRVADFQRLDQWSRAVLEADGGAIEKKDFAPFLRGPVWSAQAKAAPVPLPTISAERQAGNVVLRLKPGNAGRELRLFVRPSVDVKGASFDGVPVQMPLAAGEWSTFGFVAPSSGGVSLNFPAATKGRIEVKLAEVADGWPAGTIVPERPASLMPWRYSDITVGLADYATSW